MLDDSFLPFKFPAMFMGGAVRSGEILRIDISSIGYIILQAVTVPIHVFVVSLSY